MPHVDHGSSFWWSLVLAIAERRAPSVDIVLSDCDWGYVWRGHAFPFVACLVSMEVAMDQQRTLTDEDMETVGVGAGTARVQDADEQDTDEQDTDGTDQGDADQSDADSTDARDS